MIILGEIEKSFKFAILQMARKAISQRTQKKETAEQSNASKLRDLTN